MPESPRQIAQRPAARWDLIEIAVSVGRQNPVSVDRFLEAVEADFHHLAQWPDIGSPQELRTRRDLKLRRWPVSGFPTYLIFYTASKHEVVIQRVVHGARDLEPIVAQIDE